MEFRTGENCWRTPRADRLAFLIDADAYFRAFRSAATRARRSITIVGWDLDGRIDLCGGREPDDGLPTELGRFLSALVDRNDRLEVRLLVWDFTLIYALERDWLTPLRFGWNPSKRLIYRTDREHPTAASHHQKLVVVDDRVAFVGGIDLGARRWDTRAHAPGEDGRTDPSGDPYPPFHDVQAVLDGDAARALGELARTRWRRSGAEPFEATPDTGGDSDPWPEGVEPDVRDVDVAIARTEPEYDGRDEVREVERLHLDAIEAARDWIYIENQYFTSDRVGEALARRLEQPRGPQIVVVVPEHTAGWLERQTMDVLRARWVHRLERADRHDRLRIVSPRIPDLDTGSLNVHAKIVIVDRRLARVGSANLSNRSMGLDTECDVAIAAGDDEDTELAIERLLTRLLAEHLDANEDAVRERLRDPDGGPARVVDALSRPEGRTLIPFRPDVDGLSDRFVPDSTWIDPERPVDAGRFLERLVGSTSAVGDADPEMSA